MPRPEKEPSAAPDAEALFREFRRRQAEEGLGFEEFVSRHPAHADALRALHSLYCAEQTLPRSDPGSEDASHVTGEIADSGPEALSPLFDRLARSPVSSSGASALLPGDEIEGFKILQVLGEGGFGIVYRAEQERPVRRIVALKVLKLGMDSREIVARFEAERQALALMNHPSIARIFEAGLTRRGRPYFAMEYIAGVPILEYCRKHALTVRSRLFLFTAVCEAVQHAHQKAIIHRDLKPSNVLVTLEGGTPLPKIIDFGVAKATGARLTEKTLYTELGRMIGTPAYMSPEQAEMSGLDIDTRTDIYSLGAMLYELLTGVLPFDPETLRKSSFTELQRIIRKEDPPTPSARVSRLERADRGVPPGECHPMARSRELRGDLDWIVVKAMAKDRTCRYGTASELAIDIRRHLEHEPVLAGPPGLGYRLCKLARKHRAALVLLGAAVLLVVAVAGAVWIHRESQYRERIESARAGVESGDIDSAKTSLALLLEEHPEQPEVKELARRVSALELDLLSARSQRLLDAARETWRRYLTLRSHLNALEISWLHQQWKQFFWAPPWHREQEFQLFELYQSARKQMEASYEAAMADFQRAVETAPPSSAVAGSARREFAAAYRAMYQAALAEGEIAFGPEFFEKRGADLDPRLFSLRGGKVTASVEPPGFTAHCFIFLEHEKEKRLLPVPVDPDSGTPIPGGWDDRLPPLSIEKVWDPDRSPFEENDLLLEVNGKSTRSWTDLATALHEVPADSSVDVLLDRDERKRVLSWVPFPSRVYADPDEPTLKPGSVLDIRAQFGFTLEAYPLQLRDALRIPLAPDGGSFEIDLPAGSYLFVLREEGCAELRLPLYLAGKDVSARIRLLREDEIPRGFTYIPPGPFFCGGDSRAFQSLPYAEMDLDHGYFIGTSEITFERYLEFLNDPIHPIDQSGFAEPASEFVIEYSRSKLRAETIDLLPRWDREKAPAVERGAGGRWIRSADVVSDRWPVFGVSQLAAREYAHWLTERKHGSGRWMYRLPTDLEWEKAARGADR
ncbi:MAG: protein kinase, partial [Planctomycetes bacterium]|nr:protein kinase [Planctomycetota bacterium]